MSYGNAASFRWADRGSALWLHPNFDEDDYHLHWENKAKHEKARNDALMQRNARLRSLVECLMHQDPNARVKFDGPTILEVWRNVAAKVLAPDPVVNAADNGPLWFWDVE